MAEEKRVEENATIEKDTQEAFVSPEDIRYMKEAIRQAKKAAALGDVPIGCVIVSDGKIIAMRKACKKMGDWRLEDGTM